MNRRPSLFHLFTVAFSLVCVQAMAAVAPLPSIPAKKDLIQRLKEIQAKQSSEIQKLDGNVKKLFQESTAVSLRVPELSTPNRRIKRIGDQLSTLDQRRAEFLARHDLLDELIFAVDTKWSSQPLKSFFETTCLDLAYTDFTDVRADGRFWKFLVYLSIAVREIPDNQEDVLSLIQSYMQYASVLNPKTPGEFLATRNYTNGSLSATAHPYDRAELGEFLEERLRELKGKDFSPFKDGGNPDANADKSKDTADIELRLSRPAFMPLPSAGSSPTAASNPAAASNPVTIAPPNAASNPTATSLPIIASNPQIVAEPPKPDIGELVKTAQAAKSGYTDDVHKKSSSEVNAEAAAAAAKASTVNPPATPTPAPNAEAKALPSAAAPPAPGTGENASPSNDDEDGPYISPDINQVN